MNFGQVKSGFQSFGNQVKGAATSAAQGVKGAAQSAGNGVKGAFQTLTGPSADEQAYYRLTPVRSLLTGDVLIVKVWGLNSAAISNVIRGGQGVASFAAGSSNNQHALIMISPTRTSEANGSGLHSTTVDTRAHTVWRCNNPLLAKEAAYVGSVLAGVKGKLANAGYNYSGCGTAIFRQKYVGPVTKAYLERVFNAVYGHGQPVKMFCSQLAATCYEVAAMRLGTTALEVDPAAMSPKALEAAFKAKPSLFQLAGRYPA